MGGVIECPDVLLGDDEDMRRSLRFDVVERKKKLIFVRNLRGDGIIDDIQEKADKALNAMTITNNDVDSGLHSINELMNSFNNILASVEAVNSQITDITNVGQQMAAGSEVVTASVGGLSTQFTTVSSKVIEFTREIGNQVEEMETLKHAATELNDKSAKLEELLRKFQIGTV